MTINQHFIFKIFSIVLIVILASHPFAQANTLTTSSTKDDNFKLQPGDIILTKGPVLFGFFGHSSIALNHDTVLQIEGPGQKPITESFDSFKERFGEGKNDWIKVYRCSKAGAGQKAANWASQHYKDSDKTYLVTLNPKSERFTYCTKIIYQAYKYGVNKNAVNDQGLLIISPYALVDNFTEAYQLKLVKTY
ncbi:hypothetical protein MT340_009965 [Staphylococcus sp. NRL 16/872]|uniref:lipoprotein N-acylation protein LnsA n=1 Tax=Staphylococcus sp. NRL 16/872 TaxID=2930131 RepID=UPI001FB2CDA1|nr:lipoprotein N-acylation protein LnsA [Staphylococcus sp. NRL 16/872]MCJ1656858.1 hypothetical protein [Staphylococcus sp. NRL 21/187]MCJ1668707.1 hypothetical protein [Staphylococcus sp. NRL 19/737]WEN68924.1 hypothetical protein MT340_009965 [Staphylococcus sp. NRL 16/872]